MGAYSSNYPHKFQPLREAALLFLHITTPKTCSFLPSQQLNNLFYSSPLLILEAELKLKPKPFLSSLTLSSQLVGAKLGAVLTSACSRKLVFVSRLHTRVSSSTSKVSFACRLSAIFLARSRYGAAENSLEET